MNLHTINRADGIFPVRELDWQNQYYTADLDGAPYCYLHVQISTDQYCMLHITLLHFSRRVLRECLADYRELQRILKAQGIKLMLHLKDEPFEQWEKLMHVLGFGPIVAFEVNGKPYKRVILEVE